MWLNERLSIMMTDLELPPERWGAENDFVDHLIKAVGDAVAVSFAYRVSEICGDDGKQPAVVTVIEQVADGGGEIAVTTHIDILLTQFVNGEQRRVAH